DGVVTYRAIAGSHQSTGRSPGEALDKLISQLPEEETGTLLVLQNMRPDRFFTEAQRVRLAELMTRWRTARDRGQLLPPDEQAELDALVDAEVRASGERAAARTSISNGAMAPHFQETATPEEWGRALREWSDSHERNTPLLSDEAISRESIYGERG